ncbi:MAG: type II toxin-antitoxin system VapC family toxin [Treponema sp.]|nr:type II toxin-antitoxin system VapC family toxin [Treponema sp.]
MNSYLLDTHAAIWFFENNTALSSSADRIIRDGTNLIYLSVASAWELTIKISVGKLSFPGDAAGFLQIAQNNDVIVIPIDASHLTALKELPFIHRDPFDRLLIATTIAEQMTLITADDNIAKYDIPQIW